MRVIRGVGAAGALAEGSVEGVWHDRGQCEQFVVSGIFEFMHLVGLLRYKLWIRVEHGMMGDLSHGAQEHTKSENKLKCKLNEPRIGFVSTSHEPAFSNYGLGLTC